MGVIDRVRIGRRRLAAPFFAATASEDDRLWPWTRDVRPDAVLVSYDVLKMNPQWTLMPVARTLRFRGFSIVDSGGYGVSTEKDPAAVYRVQRAVGADLAVALDKVALSTDSTRAQRAAVKQTLRNARAVRRGHRGATALEAVVQGVTPSQLSACAEGLARIGFQVYGVPVSMQSKYRRYAAAVERIAHAASGLPPRAMLHALGCGSRTLMAILSYVGVTIFDSRSYYQRAMYGENIRSVTLCAVGEPRGKAACASCLQRRKPGSTAQGRTDYNLSEILKEICRIRCALEESRMEQYLARRLEKKVAGTVLPLIDKLPSLAIRRRGSGRR